MRNRIFRFVILATALGMPAMSSIRRAEACSKCLSGLCLDEENGIRICRVVKGKATLKCKGGGKIDVGILTKGITVEGGCEFEGTQECEDIGSCSPDGPKCDPTIMSCPPPFRGILGKL